MFTVPAQLIEKDERNCSSFASILDTVYGLITVVFIQNSTLCSMLLTRGSRNDAGRADSAAGARQGTLIEAIVYYLFCYA